MQTEPRVGSAQVIPVHFQVGMAVPVRHALQASLPAEGQVGWSQVALARPSQL